MWESGSRLLKILSPSPYTKTPLLSLSRLSSTSLPAFELRVHNRNILMLYEGEMALAWPTASSSCGNTALLSVSWCLASCSSKTPSPHCLAPQTLSLGLESLSLAVFDLLFLSLKPAVKEGACYHRPVSFQWVTWPSWAFFPEVRKAVRQLPPFTLCGCVLLLLAPGDSLAPHQASRRARIQFVDR